MSAPLFANRLQAAEVLAERLARLPLGQPCVVLALPRGGVPIGAVVARRLGVPLDLLLVRKIGAPWQPELAVGAVVDGGEPVLVVDERAASTGADAAYIERQGAQAWNEILRRRALYLAGRAPVPLKGATVVLVDDGIATGNTMRAALQALRRRGVAHTVLAVPVAPHETLMRLAGLADRVVCLAEPPGFRSVGEHYAEFPQVDDDEVVAALRAAARPAA
ncbi:MAG: phosphoribosyltransferase [Betaproteobacteria bacterium]